MRHGNKMNDLETQPARLGAAVIWSLLGAIALCIMGFMATPATASPLNQTVPNPTPTPTQAPIPQATPTSVPEKDDQRDSDQDNSGGDDQAEDDNNSVQDAGAVPASVVDAPAAESPTPAQPSLALPLTGEVTVARLNVRAGPGTDFDLIGTLAAGDRVNILARTEDAAWIVICCLAEQEKPGWTTVQFVTPVGMEWATAGAQLPVVATLADLATLTPAAAEIDAVGPASGSVPVVTTTLQLAIEQPDQLVKQGDTFPLRVVISNTGESTAQAVRVRSEIPAGLTYAETEAARAADIQLDGAVLTIDLAEVDAGAVVPITLGFAVDTDLPDGVVIDMVAAVAAANGEGASGSTSIGMPPATLATFQ